MPRTIDIECTNASEKRKRIFANKIWPDDFAEKKTHHDGLTIAAYRASSAAKGAASEMDSRCEFRYDLSFTVLTDHFVTSPINS